MHSLQSMMYKVITDCDLYLNGELFSREHLMREFAEFLSATADKNRHNAGIVLHTGSVCFDAVAFVFAALSCLTLNESDPDDVIDSLSEGDMVVYDRGRYLFAGKKDYDGNLSSEYIALQQQDTHHSRRYVPRTMWNKVTPYYGSATSTDGRGIRRGNKKRTEFCTSVLGMEASEIPSVFDKSVVVVTARERADEIAKGLTIRFGDTQFVRLLDLVTASYYTENDEYPYGGNVGKTDAILKITGRLSTARNMVLSRDGNICAGLMVLGDEFVTRGWSELPELVKRKSLKYVYISVHIDSEHGAPLVTDYSDAEVFACTKDFLLSNSLFAQENNSLARQLAHQVDTIIETTNDPVVINGVIGWDGYRKFKKAMFAIQNHDYNRDDKADFIVQAYSLLNLFTTSVFGIGRLEALLNKGVISSTVPPEARLTALVEEAKGFPDEIAERAAGIIDFLETQYLSQYETSEKEAYLHSYLAERKNRRIAVIIPKAYYEPVMRYGGCYDLMDSERNLIITTPNRFDNNALYDEVISVGNISGRRYEAFRCRSARRIVTLLYEYEMKLFNVKTKESKRIDRLFNSRSTKKVESDEAFFDSEYAAEPVSDNEVSEIARIDESIDEYVRRINETSMLRSFWTSGNESQNTQTAEAVAVAVFEAGERAFFTKRYKAYVFDEENGAVDEVDVKDLDEGDSIVFTRKDDETRDIVDYILNQLISGNRLNADVIEAYKKSKHWKQALINYMREKNVNAKSIAVRMIENGVGVEEATIRGWLDEDSHTVGPRSEDSIQQIALIVEDEEMFENSKEYHDACAEIRSVRKSIRKQIGDAILRKLAGKAPASGTFKEVYEKIDSLAIVLRLETISFVSQQIPVNFSNRPISQ